MLQLPKYDKTRVCWGTNAELADAQQLNYMKRLAKAGQWSEVTDRL